MGRGSGHKTKPSREQNSQTFFLNDGKIGEKNCRTNEETLEKIDHLNMKIDFLNASFTGTILDLVESSFLIKEASFNTEEALKSALETREYYEQVFEKYSAVLEN